jgi:acyl-coenzyme A thioesterase PaaI-like protein
MSAVVAPEGLERGRAEKLRRRLKSPWMLKAFMFTKLPLALFAGLRVQRIDDSECAVSVPYGWLSTNPFKSTYFAALSMAAEMSTGALAMVTVEASPVPVSILVIGMRGEFVKKATGLTTFHCTAGNQLSAAVLKTVGDGEPVVAEADTVGTDDDGNVIARFTFTWSFKRKSR